MIEIILWIVFVVACLVVSAVVLLQEGKGGGLGEAFGGAGQQTFGVKAEGINRFTGWASVAVVLIAIAITKIRSDASTLEFTEPAAPPAVEQEAEQAGANGAQDAAPPAEAPPQAPAQEPASEPAQEPAPAGGDGGGGQ